jgi:light-regulated signal transduction histidine kinase (bacteriophytochrome)
MQEVSLNELLIEVLSDMEVEIERHRVEINIGPLPVIWANESQMRQLFQNLISNGIKFRKENTTPVISVLHDKSKTALLDNANTHCRIVVKDNGIGFDEQYADEIFLVFKRLHSYHEYEGTGVGLSICKKIVDRHGGQIAASSQPGEGAMFYLDLPLFLPAVEPVDSRTKVRM